MLGLIRLLLAPILLFQGYRSRARIMRLPEPEGARAGLIGDGPELSLLILGDSAAAGVGAATQAEALSGRLLERLSVLYRVHWQVLAETGWTTPDALDALSELEAHNIDVALISLGLNDVTTKVSRKHWLSRYQWLVGRLQDGHHTKLVMVSALPPADRFPALPQPLRWYLGAQTRRYDRALAAWAAKTPGVHHLPFDYKLGPEDMAEDGFHPGPTLYGVWATRAAKVILAGATNLGS